MNKKLILQTLVILWLAASTAYIANDVWQDFKSNKIKKAFESGSQDVIGRLFQEASQSQCKPFQVSDGKSQISLIDASCIPVQNQKETQSSLNINKK